MKKTTLFSIVAATMLLTGCNNSNVKEVTAKVSETGSSAMDTAREKIDKAAEAAKAKAAEAVEAAKEKASKAVEAAKEKASEAAETAKEKAAGVTEAAETAKEKAGETVEAAKEKASEAAETAKEKAAETAETSKKETMPKSTEHTPENPDVKPAASAAENNQGKTLYAKCAGCHGADGKTKALGKSDVIAGMDAAVIAEDLKGYKAGTLNKHGMGGIMKGQAAPLSDADISALSAFISSLK